MPDCPRGNPGNLQLWAMGTQFKGVLRDLNTGFAKWGPTGTHGPRVDSWQLVQGTVHRLRIG
jgi:hypothetical protein